MSIQFRRAVAATVIAIAAATPALVVTHRLAPAGTTASPQPDTDHDIDGTPTPSGP